ncbi:hypothetical protein D3C72_1356650 [compost metagenome]
MFRASAIPADEQGGDGSARLGFLRHHHRDRRRLRRPSVVRHGDHRPSAGSPGLSRRHHCPAELAVQRRLHEARRAEPVLRCRGRQHGLDDQPLHRGQENPLRRCLHAGWPGRQASGPRQPGLQPALQGSLQARADRARRHRSVPAPHRPLRLLAGPCTQLDPDRRQRRHPALR